MNVADVTVSTDAPITRAETRVPGGVVITVVTLKGPRFRARNLIGVMLRDDLGVTEWASFADAAAALRRFAAGDAPPPRKVDRCRHCRGSHASDACQVHAEAERRRATLRAALAAKGAATKDQPARGRGEDEDHGNEARRNEISKPGDAAARGNGAARDGDVGERRRTTEPVGASSGEPPRTQNGGNSGSEGTAPVTAPARTVDDYFDGLEFASRTRAVPVSDVVRVVHGASATRAQRDDTELALDELVAQGRADRDVAERYRARRPERSESESPTPMLAMPIYAAPMEDPAECVASPDWEERLDAVEAAVRVAEDPKERPESTSFDPTCGTDVLPRPRQCLPGMRWERRSLNAGGGWVIRDDRFVLGGFRPLAEGFRWWAWARVGSSQPKGIEADTDGAVSRVLESISGSREAEAAAAGVPLAMPDDQARRPAVKLEMGPDPAVDTWADDGGAPPPPDAPDPVAYTEPEVHPEPGAVPDDLPDVPSPAEILDPETLQPEDPAECDDTADVSTVGAHVAELGAPAPADALATIEQVAARHAPRPELDSVEAVLEEASALRRRTEIALSVASRDLEEANAREAAARAEHEAAFREAKAKSERLRQVQQLATQLGVDSGAP